MAPQQQVTNHVRRYRQSRGWTQSELAERAGVSRAAVSAIEVGRLLPSVSAAISLARAFGCTVEDLFSVNIYGQAEPAWAWRPATTPCRYWQAKVQGRVLYYPVEAVSTGEFAHDGVYRDGSFVPSGNTDPTMTLVLASCDPAVGLLAEHYARSSKFRLLALTRSSQQALSLLGQGLIHVAGIHYATRDQPDGNIDAVQNHIGTGYHLLRVAWWQEGLAVGRGVSASSVSSIIRTRLRWVGREPGSVVARCLEELLHRRQFPRRIAYHHRGVAEAVLCGWADVGVCHRFVCEEAGLKFFLIREEVFDLCFPVSSAGDPRIQALVRVVRSAVYRSLLSDLPGYDTTHAGELQTLR
jgi:molybdate-binding protein/DNA-binding XRE family transcriptional regulator